MPNNPESAPNSPSDTVREKMHADNNDWERNYNYRGVEDTLPQGGPAFADGTRIGFSNPAYNNGSTDEYIATKAPNAFVELANLQNRHDEDEKVATLDRTEEIGKPRLNLFKRRELGKLASRLGVIDPMGNMAELHKKFKDANIEALIDNAHAQAAFEGVTINTGEVEGQTIENVAQITKSKEVDKNSEEHASKVTALGNVFHEVWLRTRNKRSESGAIYANGEREAREKKTSDIAWSKKRGEGVVDIANTGFVNLPEDWKAENAAAAEVIVDLIEEMGGAEKIDLSDPKIYAKAGSIIHDRWLERNTYAQDGELDVPFTELPLEERSKDLEQLNIALQLFMPEKEGVRPRAFETRALQVVNNWALEKHLPMRSLQGELIDPNTEYYEDQRDMLMAGLR